jgi:hypothetical protein
MEEYALKFNGKIRTIVRKVVTLNSSPEMNRLKQRINIVINATPLLLIEHSSHLWKHKDFVQNLYDSETETFNWDNLNNVEIDDIISPNDKANTEVGDIDVLFTFIKNLLMDANDNEREDLYDDIIEALNTVAMYRKYCKTNGITISL